jgi:hypothetical protein
MNDALDPIPARQRHRAVVLGLCLGAACLALLVASIIIFSNTGLPKDPKEWKRLQQQRAASSEPGAAQTPKDPPR